LLLLLDLTNIAQHNIPNSTAAPTHHLSICKTFSFKIFKNTFVLKKIFGPFPSHWGAFAFHFRIPLLTLLVPIFFPTFRPFLHFLLQGIHLLMIGTHLILTGVTNLRPVALTWPTFFTTPSTSPPPSPLHHEAVDPNLHCHP